MTHLRRLVPLAAAALLAACASSQPAPPDAGPADGATPADPDATEQVVLRVTGMTCPVRCPREVQVMLATAPGVVAVSVDWEERQATCTVRAGTDPRSLCAALRPPYAARVVTQ